MFDILRKNKIIRPKFRKFNRMDIGCKKANKT